jgi:hypothetical protein
MTLPTDYEDGETIFASHLNGTNDAVNDLTDRVDALPLSGEPLLISGTVSNEAGLPPSADLGEVLVDEETGDGFQWNGLGWTNFGQFRGPQGPVAAYRGLLSARPAAGAVAVNTIYFVTDENGGTLTQTNGTSWVQVAPSINDATAGKVLASADPVSAAALATTVGSTYYRIPELTTGSFMMPSVTCTASFTPLRFTSVTVAGTAVQLRFTTDAWSTSKIMGGWTEASFASNTSVFPGASATLRELGGSAPSAGATVQVALFAAHPSDTSISPAILHLFNLTCLLEVRAN